MTEEFENPEYNRFQCSPQKSLNSNNYEESFEADYDEAFDNADSLKASSITMNYSISKTGNFEEHMDLPPAKYDTPIEEHPEENEDSKYNQPTQEELDLQNKRIQKAQEALIKMKKEETAKKLSKRPRPQTADKPKIVQKKELPSITKKKSTQPPNSNSNPKPSQSQSKSKSTPFIVESSKPSGTFAFQIEKPIKGTNQAPNEKPSIPPLKLSNSQDLKTKKLEDQAKLQEDHKANLAQLRSIFDDKKRKAEEDKKKMNEMQKKLLNTEKNYIPPDRTKDRVKVTPPPPPAPKPRALTQGCYKLHQLAASTGNTEARLTADKLGGNMLQAIKVLSAKTSEEFVYNEILEEEKRLAESEQLLTMGKDMKRGEIDFHEESRKKIKIYQNLIQEHKKMLQQQAEHLKVQDSLIERVKRLEGMKAVVKLGDGKYMRAGMMPDNLIDTLSELESVGSEVMKENPIDQVIEKIEKQGCSLKDLFSLIDCDGDKILTITEIRNGLAGIHIKLNDEDKELILKTLDSNSDGVVSEEEFFKILDPKLQVQKDYRAIIGNLDINNPIIFEEQVLDMKLRGRMLHRDIPKRANQLKSKIETEQKLLNRIKMLENALASRQIKSISSSEVKKELELQMIEAEQQKDLVFQKAIKEKSSFSMNFSALQEKIQTINRDKAAVAADIEFKKRELVGSRTRAKVIIEKEEKLDKANRLIAIVIIQKKIRRYIARVRYLKEKKRVEGALNVIVPAMRKFNNNRKQEKLQNQEEIKPKIIENKQPVLEDNQSVHSQKSIKSLHSQESYHSEEQYFCIKCHKLADRICLSCKKNSCELCFAECRISSHYFSILASRDRNLNNAEKEFILIFVQSGKAQDLLEVFEECGKKISFITFRSTVKGLANRIDLFLIKNVITISEKYLDEDYMVALEELLSNFRN